MVPGFVDIHAHLRARDQIHRTDVWPFLANLAYGVTTTRDPQTGNTEVLSYADMVRAGTVLGPRIYSTGPGMFWADGIRDGIDTEDEARDVLKRYADYFDTGTVKMYIAVARKGRQHIHWALWTMAAAGMKRPANSASCRPPRERPIARRPRGPHRQPARRPSEHQHRRARALCEAATSGLPVGFGITEVLQGVDERAFGHRGYGQQPAPGTAPTLCTSRRRDVSEAADPVPSLWARRPPKACRGVRATGDSVTSLDHCYPSTSSTYGWVRPV